MSRPSARWLLLWTISVAAITAHVTTYVTRLQRTLAVNQAMWGPDH